MDKRVKLPPEARPINRPAVQGLLSRTGPEAPPDQRQPAGGLPGRFFADEATQQYPVIAGRSAAYPPGTPTPRRLPPPKVAARAVIVYEPEPRRRWGLWVLTVILVSLTVGVVLGQTVAYQPRSVSAAAQTPPTAGLDAPPSVGTPSNATPGQSPPGQTPPLTGQQVTAPLGKARAQQLEVSGHAAALTVRSVDLGDRLFDIAALDESAVPRVVSLKGGPRLEFVPTGAPGRIGAVIQLNSKVKWKLRLVGGADEQDIDMLAGGLAGIDLVGGAARTVLRLPAPTGTVPLTVSGALTEFDVHAGSTAPVRVRLRKGADSAVVDGKTRKQVTSGTTLTTTGWKAATNRYDITATVKIGKLLVDHT